MGGRFWKTPGRRRCRGDEARVRRIFTLIGLVTVTLIVGAVAVIVIFAPRGRELSKTSREFAKLVLDRAVRTWDVEKIRSVSSTEMLSSASQEDFSRLLQAFADRLGNIDAYDEPEGEANVGFKNFHEVDTAEYVFPVSFDRGGRGQITLRLVQENNGWKLLALEVSSPALVQ
jgi:hypothetical protein